MLDMYMNCYSECKMKEFYQKVSTANMDMVLQPDMQYIVVDNEKCEKEFIFGILGKAHIFENNPFGIYFSFMLRGNCWVSVMECKKDTSIYIETQDHILAMLSIIKENEKNGIMIYNNEYICFDVKDIENE